MSRSGYTDYIDDLWEHIRWRGAVASAIRGSRGQALLREMLAALDAMPERALTSESLVNAEGDYCALGVLGKARGMDLTSLDPEDPEGVAEAFGIAPALAKEIVYENDEGGWYEYDDPHQDSKRWRRMRAWVQSNLAVSTNKPEAP